MFGGLDADLYVFYINLFLIVQLWDPRTGSCLSTLYGHKNTVTKVAWNDNGNWLLTSSRDQLIKLYDIRAMKELCSLKGHHKEVTSIAWHPVYETVFASGGMDGTLIYWNIGEFIQCKKDEGFITFLNAIIIDHSLCCISFDIYQLSRIGPKGSEEPAAKIPYARK